MKNEVFNLPASWVLVSVADLGKIISGGTPSTKEPSYWGGSINWISPSDLTGYANKHISKGAKSITEAGLKNSSATVMPAGSVHFSSRAPIGYTVISAETMTTNQGFKSLVPSGGVFNEFVYYYFKSAKQLAESKATGTTFKEISGTAFSKLSIPLPPTNEQHRIVAKIEELFSELDKGIENLKTAREQLKVYRQALLKHAFEGKLTAQWREQNRDKLETAAALLARIQTEREQRYQQQFQQWQTTGGSKPKAPKHLPPLAAEELAELPELPEGWFGARLGWMTCSVEYGTSAKSSESGVCSVLRMGNIQNGKFDWSDLVYTDDEAEIEKYLLHYGDVLFNRTNSPELVGKSAIFKSKQPAIFAGYLIRVNQIPSIVDSQYVNYFLNSHIAKQHGSTVKTDGVNQSNINGVKLVNYPFPFCSLEEQKMIVEILDARISEVDQLEQTLATSLQQAEALRQSILKKAFSGQLVAQDANDEPAAALLARIKSEREQSDKLKRGRKTA
jgi:type I restriction enzyme S subunit